MSRLRRSVSERNRARVRANRESLKSLAIDEEGGVVSGEEGGADSKSEAGGRGKLAAHNVVVVWLLHTIRMCMCVGREGEAWFEKSLLQFFQLLQKETVSELQSEPLLEMYASCHSRQNHPCHSLA